MENLKQMLVDSAFKDGVFSHNKLRSRSNESLRYLCSEKTQFLPEGCSDSQRAWHVYNELYEYPLCSGGNERKSFTTFEGGYAKTCHLHRFECSCWDTARESSSTTMKKTNDSGKIHQALQEKYGVDHVTSIPGVREKISAVKKEHSEEWVEKMQSIMIDRYGVKTTLQSTELRAKYHLTMLSRYGADSVLGSPLLREKVQETLIQRYGVDNFQQRKLKEILDQLQTASFWDRFTSTTEAKLFLQDWLHPESVMRYIHRHRPDLIGTGYRISSPHQRIIDLLNNHQIEHEINTRNIINPQELDIYIPSKKLAIEVNGIYWHSELAGGKDSSYHLKKLTECEKHGIQLLQFWDVEVERKWKIVESMIGNYLNQSKRINARDCVVVVDLSVEEERGFLEQNHLQGYTSSMCCRGLLYQGQLVSLMSFRSSRYNSKFDLELLRYASLCGVVVVGGASKLFSRRPEGSIITYADRRYSQGHVYRTSGWKLFHHSAPSYYYTQDYQTLVHRSSFQKHLLQQKLETFDPSLTEWQNMQMNGFDRIWDCGTLVFGRNPKSCSIQLRE